MDLYISEYKNEYSESWTFKHDYATNTSILTGSDIGFAHYPVVEGEAWELVLNKGEKNWLRSSWAIATKKSGLTSIYSNHDTEFVAGEKGCWLTNNYCPICLRQKMDFEIHHCIPSVEGGTDDFFNLLMVCNTCHAIITWGSMEDRVPKDLAAFNHQFMYFGMKFFPRNNPTNAKHKHINFLENYPDIKEALSFYDNSNSAEQESFDLVIKRIARYKYRYFRDVGKGLWLWGDCFKNHQWLEPNDTKYRRFMELQSNPQV